MPAAPRASYSAHKLKYDTVMEAYSKDMEEAAGKCLQSLQHLLDNTYNFSPQRHADKAYDIVNITIKNVADKHIPPRYQLTIPPPPPHSPILILNKTNKDTHP